MPVVDLSGSAQELLSLTAAAKRLHVNYRRLRAAVRSGDLPAYRVGGKRSHVPAFGVQSGPEVLFETRATPSKVGPVRLLCFAASRSLL